MSGLTERLGFSLADGARLRAQIGHLPLSPLAGFIGQGLVVGPTVCLLGGLGEELAWRGLLHRELRRSGFWRCTAVTGALWGFWHVPLTLQGYGYPAHPVVGTAVVARLRDVVRAADDVRPGSLGVGHRPGDPARNRRRLRPAHPGARAGRR